MSCKLAHASSCQVKKEEKHIQYNKSLGKSIGHICHEMPDVKLIEELTLHDTGPLYLVAHTRSTSSQIITPGVSFKPPSIQQLSG